MVAIPILLAIHLDQIHLLPVAPVLRRLLLMLRKQNPHPHQGGGIAVNHACALSQLPPSSHRQPTPHHHPVVAVNLKGRPKPVDQLQDFTYARMSVPPLLLYCVALLVRWLLLLKRFQNQQPNQPHTPLR